MKVGGKPMRSIWVEADGAIGVIDQTVLPHEFRTVRLSSRGEAAPANYSVLVRGAARPRGGGAYGKVLAGGEDA
ncbi:MAG: S-methyl-5-thioribose-1-phosphate isomerase, partial [Pseudolabrys sp.]